MISKVKKDVYEDMNTQVQVKEPFRDPPYTILREDFHKPYSHSPPPKVTSLRDAAEPVILRSSNLNHSPALLNEEEEEEVIITEGSDPIKAIQQKIDRLEKALRDKTDRCITTGDCLVMVTDYRKYEATKADHFQDMVKKLKCRIREDSKCEVDNMLKERKALQLDAYRMSRMMQQKIANAVKNEANILMIPS